MKELIRLKVKTSYNRESIIKALTEEGYTVKSVYEKENDYSTLANGFWVVTIYNNEETIEPINLEDARLGPGVYYDKV